MIAKMGCLFDWQAQRELAARELLATIEQRRDTFTKMGLSERSRVFLPCSSSFDFFASLMSLWSLGAAVIPLDTRLTPTETAALKLKAGDSVSLPPQIDWTSGKQPLLKWPQASRRESLILFTTGTLSVPRGVILSSLALENKIASLGSTLPLSDMSSTLCFLPLSFGHGLIGNSLVPWLNGASLTIMPTMDVASAQALPDVLRHRGVTFFSSVPGVWALLARMIEPVLGLSVKRIFCASAPMGENIFKTIQKLFPGVPLHNVYGLTEMASWIAMSPEIETFRPGQIGFSIDGEVKLENHEIYVRGDSAMNGYLGETPRASGDWIRTSDRADYRAPDGYILRGRLGNIVNKGGIKIQLEEIEDLLQSHPNVRGALCFKTEDREVGENFEVGLVLADSTPDAREKVQSWFADRVSLQRRPSRWHFINSLPVNARGKPDRSELKRTIGQVANSQK
jgi:acyl-CoA synthetase (AMP-forming)/AMP-acid ligase II